MALKFTNALDSINQGYVAKAAGNYEQKPLEGAMPTLSSIASHNRTLADNARSRALSVDRALFGILQGSGSLSKAVEQPSESLTAILSETSSILEEIYDILARIDSRLGSN